jgi:phenylpropionate dioxygenase-like ring-hydroxylating dioxygenase large terminal subunit
MPDTLAPASSRQPGTLSEPLHWPAEGATRVPFRVYHDPEILKLEHERIFRGPVWNYLAMEIEVPNHGDFKTTFVGEIPVIVTRNRDGQVHAMVNRCAHKGALVCMQERGNRQRLSCVYHSWTYDLTGQLRGVAFQDGLRGKGGMPEDFDLKNHRLEPLRVAVLHGMIFGTFSDETPPIEDYLGEMVCKTMERNFSRPHKIIGYHSQIIHNNWKLYAENVRDSYHATLLHTFYTTFKINRLDMDGGMILADPIPWHSLSYAKRATVQEDEGYKDVHSAQFDENALQGPELLESFHEFDDNITHMIQSNFPNLTFQFTLNSLAVRHFVPKGPGKTELHWYYIGYEDDTPEQEEMRINQGNLTGAAGYVSLEDGCINEFVQRGSHYSADANEFLEMGGKTAETSEGSRATETSIRGFWTGYRQIMGFND